MDFIEEFCTGNSRYQAAQIFEPVGIILHSIGTPQPSAKSLHNYWVNNGSPYLTHYNLDDTTVYHNMPDNYKCWHVGSPGNAQYLGCEMGEPSQIHYTSGASFTCDDVDSARAYCVACYNNAVDLFSYICKKYGWNPLTSIHTHYELTVNHLSNTDHVDPQHLWNGLDLPYSADTFRQDVKNKMEGSAPNVTPTSDDEEQIYRIRQSWEDADSQIGAYKVLQNAIDACPDGYGIYDKDGNRVGAEAESEPSNIDTSYQVKITASALNVRNIPSTGGSVVNVLKNGGIYTIVENQNGWGLLKSYADDRDGWIYLSYTERV